MWRILFLPSAIIEHVMQKMEVHSQRKWKETDLTQSFIEKIREKKGKF